VLKPELAREQLGKIRSKKNKKARYARVQKLPKPLAALGMGIFGLLPDGQSPKEWSARRKLEQSSTTSLSLDPKGRAKVFAALFPTLAKEVEAGWQVLGQMPCTTGYIRRGFRCPGRPEMYVSNRQDYLEHVFNSLAEIPDDILTTEWVAAWAGHLGYRSDEFGYLLAGVIDAGGEQADAVLNILKDSAASRHEIGGPGGHAIRGLLCCSKPEAWEFAEKLLLAAQRQEGLRQTILEAVDEAHPEVFHRMVGVVLDNNLIRFASVARAAGVWFGEDEEVENPKKLKADLQSCRELLQDPAARKKAIEKGDAQTAYRGLWALAFIDLEAAVKLAIPLLKDKAATRRCVAAKLMTESGLPEVAPLMLPLLNDPDPRLVSQALYYFGVMPSAVNLNDDDDETGKKYPADLFERIERIVPSLPPKEKELKPVVPGWMVPDCGQETAAELLLECLGKRPAERLLPYLSMMSEYRRVTALAKVCEPRTLSNKVRQTLLAIAGEPNRYVREAAMKYLKLSKLAEDEVPTIEGYLTRKTPDFRRSVFELLLNRPDKLVAGTIDRLLAAGDANQRGAGIELSRRMVDSERMAEPIRERLRDYREAKGKRLAKPEDDAIEIVLNPASRPPTLENGLGLFDLADRTPVVPPKNRKVKLVTPASIAFLKSLDAFIHEHRDKTYIDKTRKDKPEEKVLGSIRWAWEFPGTNIKLSAAKDRENLPLLELWQEWWQNRPASTRDADGLELIRAMNLPREEIREGEEHDDDDDDDNKQKTKPSAAFTALLNAKKLIKPGPAVKVMYDDLMPRLFDWFAKLHPPEGLHEFLLDAAETALSLVPEIVIEQTKMAPIPGEENEDEDEDDDGVADWRSEDEFEVWLNHATAQRNSPGWTAKHDARLYRLFQWRDEPIPGAGRMRPIEQVLMAGYEAGAANLTDVYDHLIGPRDVQRWGSSFRSLASFTEPIANKCFPLLEKRPELREAIDAVVARVIDAELTRGETPTDATRAANDISLVKGLETIFRLMAALGKNGFSSGDRYSASQNKPAVLTHLIKQSVPTEADTPATFAAAAKKAVAEGLFPIERVAEFGLVNPRWVQHVTAAIGWPGFEEAVYWFIAHTDSRWKNQLGVDTDDTDDDDIDDDESIDEETKKAKPESPWQTIVKARTNLTSEQLADGLIDVAWFHTAYEAIGNDKRWDAIEGAAKFLGYGQSHKKAARLADVLLGRAKKKDLVESIRKKFLKESVRLLGLLPLPEDPAKLQTELADRYKVLKEYERYARGLSSLSKEPAMKAARLGMENLAVTAGFPDPVRLEWAVTADEAADLVNGSAKVTVSGVTAALGLSDFGEPDVTFTQAGKAIEKLPKDFRKNPKVAELLERKKAVLRTLSSTKRSLEQAMCSGSKFVGTELKSLMTHPLVRPILERLVLKLASGMGYPFKGGAALKGHDGKTIAIKATDEWSVAHPLDFVKAKNWPDWQTECFKTERVQPFKQVFREVYVLTAAEKEDVDQSRRYSGQQVNETQAKALFASRGWSTRDGIDKLFRDANLVVSVSFDEGISTPADAAAPAIGQVVFHQRGDWKSLKLADIPAALFSEVMRDLDLVVSVAHVGGVDPEATQSTTEMRAALLKTTCGFLKLANVKIDGKHALIHGEYGKYSVHLGSGVVHKQPGGSLCVVPVNAQHRGRLFLPFADDDPRTAEVVTKVLMLSRDKEIQDPTILQQIMAK
jgi:hypothetical protein